MTFSEGWRDQYERTLRSRQRLDEAAGPSSMGSKAARDILFHFFQDAYHLKDWVKNDPALGLSDVDKKDLETHVRNTITLALCADLCNGVKHLTLTTAKTGDKTTSFTNQSVNIRIGVGAEHQWYITSGGQKYDAVGLADEVIAEWTKWLTAKELLP